MEQEKGQETYNSIKLHMELKVTSPLSSKWCLNTIVCISFLLCIHAYLKDLELHLTNICQNMSSTHANIEVKSVPLHYVQGAISQNSELDTESPPQSASVYLYKYNNNKSLCSSIYSVFATQWLQSALLTLH